jgi:hypothetical protein
MVKDELRDTFLSELEKGEEQCRVNNLKIAYAHIERAHILGQRNVCMHTRTHYWFLRIGIKQGNAKEIFGQLIRLPLGILGSFIGIVPEGNTGGSNVPIFRPMEIPEDLKLILSRRAES